MREEIRRLDAEIVRLSAERIRVARQIGEAKRERGLPIRNYVVEAEVIADARTQARGLGLSESFVEESVKLLIAEALRAQERDRRASMRSHSRGRGRRALVVGGKGAMGAWFAEFLDSKGFSVTTSDPAGALPGYPEVGDFASAADAFDLVLVAVPPAVAGDVLLSLDGRTRGLVLDIASLKTPVILALRKLAASGMNVASIHPMWGPSADLLASRNVVVCDCGAADATRAARALFEDTAANVVEVPLDAHDDYMASTLGLPHALNIVFNETLARGPHGLSELSRLGGPTFQHQLAVGREVAHENAELYHQIQQLNAHTPEVYAAVRAALDRLERSLADERAFLAMVLEARAWYSKDGGAR